MTTCYRQMNGGSITAFSGVNACSNSTSDGGFTSCCFSGTICLEDNLCYATTPAAGSAGFYEALCTDPEFKDPSCGKRCTAYTKGDVIFDPNQNDWRCCGADSTGSPNCGNPTNVTFVAQSPKVLLAEASATASSSSISSTASTTSSTTASGTVNSFSSSNTSTPNPSTGSNNSGISTGAIAGIAVGAVLGVIALAGLLCWFLLAKRRRARNDQPRRPILNQYYDQDKNNGRSHEHIPRYIHEKSNSVKYKSNPAPPYYVEMAASEDTPGHISKPDATSNVYELGN